MKFNHVAVEPVSTDFKRLVFYKSCIFNHSAIKSEIVTTKINRTLKMFRN